MTIPTFTISSEDWPKIFGSDNKDDMVEAERVRVWLKRKGIDPAKDGLDSQRYNQNDELQRTDVCRRLAVIIATYFNAAETDRLTKQCKDNPHVVYTLKLAKGAALRDTTQISFYPSPAMISMICELCRNAGRWDRHRCDVSLEELRSCCECLVQELSEIRARDLISHWTDYVTETYSESQREALFSTIINAVPKNSDLEGIVYQVFNPEVKDVDTSIGRKLSPEKEKLVVSFIEELSRCLKGNLAVRIEDVNDFKELISSGQIINLSYEDSETPDSKDGLSKEWLESQVVVGKYIWLSDTVCVCTLTLKNGAVVTGMSGCLSPSKCKESTGRELAYRDAFEKLWQLYGFVAKQQVFERSLPDGHEDKPFYEFK